MASPKATTAVNAAKAFDIEGWLTGAKIPTATVQITTRPDLVERIDQAFLELQGAERAERAVSDAGPVELRAAYEDLCTEFEESKRPFTVRARRPGDIEAIRDAIRKAKATGDDAAAVFGTAHYLIEPKMTADQVRRMADVIGSAQLDLLVEAWAELSAKAPVPSAPLSLRPSPGR